MVENHAPVILGISADPDTINTAETSLLICEASDEDGDFLGYNWAATSGRITGTGDSVIFRPSATPDSVWISCLVGDPHQGMARDSVLVIVEEAPPPPPVISLVVDAREHCYKMGLFPGAYLDLSQSSYIVTASGNDAFFDSNGPYTHLIISCETRYFNVMDLSASRSISNANSAGAYFFFVDPISVEDNFGSVTLDLVSSNGLSSASVVVNAIEHCILLEESRTAHLDLPNGSYLVYAEEHNAGYNASDLYTDIYLVTANGHSYKMPLAGFAEILVDDGQGIYAFFTDTYKIGDNEGAVTLIFD